MIKKSNVIFLVMAFFFFPLKVSLPADVIETVRVVSLVEEWRALKGCYGSCKAAVSIWCSLKC